jgi:hypothetical protein
MVTYLISLIGIAFILVFFSGKKFYEQRVKVILLSSLIALVPMTLVNGIMVKKVERQSKILRSHPLVVDTISHKSFKIFAYKSSDSSYLNFDQKNPGPFSIEYLGKEDSSLISFIKVDSLNIPRLEVIGDVPIKSKSLWYSSQGIPRTNIKRILYLPDDSIHHEIVRRWKNAS